MSVDKATISTTQVESKAILTALEKSNIIIILPLSFVFGLAEASVVPFAFGCMFGSFIYIILYKRCVQIMNKPNEKSN